MWSPGPAAPAATPDEVHIWRAWLGAAGAYCERLQALLSPDEADRAVHYRRQADRRRFVGSRGSLRLLLGSYLGIAPEQLRFAENAYGKPSLAGEGARSGLRFNVSHSGDVALFGVVSGCGVGVDVEVCRSRAPDRVLRIADRFFSPEEAEALRGLAPREQVRAFLVCWCRKEAYVKALGRGLSVPLSAFAVEARPGKPPSLLRVGWDAEETRRWRIFDLAPGEGYVGAAVAGERAQLMRCWQYGAGPSGRRAITDD